MSATKGRRTCMRTKTTKINTLIPETLHEDSIPGGGYQRLETVLVIEDQTELNHALALRLQHAGLNVASAFDGLSGLDKICHLEPDVILLDLHLPRLHGLKLLHRLRQRMNLREAPILALTGDLDPELARRAERFGVKRVFHKPVSAREIVAAVLKLLDE